MDSGRGFGNLQIVSGLRRKDPEAAIALYERSSDRIHRLVWRVLGADDEHDDVVQQVFVHALGSIDRLRDPNALDSWLVGITLNTVRKLLRARKLRRAFGQRKDRPGSNFNKHDPDRQLLTSRLYAVVERMRPVDQISFTLRFVEGYALGEVACACDCSLTTVKRRLARAKKIFLKHAQNDQILASWINSGESCKT